MQTHALSSSSLYPNAQPFVGVVETTLHALRLVHAARLGVIPRVLRRLNNRERKNMIASGAVFVFSVEESGIRRWTDGLVFSPSRIDGNFLVYKEMNEKSGGRKSDRSDSWIHMSGEGRRVHPGPHEQHGGQYHSKISFAPANDASAGGFKIGGLIKRTITVKMHGSDYHLVSYYTEEDMNSRRFRPLSSRDDIMSLDLPLHIFTFSDFRIPPRLEIDRDGLSTIVCEPATEEENLVLSGEEVRGNRTGRQICLENNASWPSSTPDHALVTSSVRNRGATSSSGHEPADNWEMQFDSRQMGPQYLFQEGKTSEGQQEYDQNDRRSPTMDSGSQYQREQRLASRPPQFADYDLSSSTPNMYFSTSQFRDSGRDQYSRQTFERRQVEEAYGYNGEASTHNDADELNPSSRTLDHYSAQHNAQWPFPQHPESYNMTAPSQSTGQQFVTDQPYRVQRHREEHEDHR